MRSSQPNRELEAGSEYDGGTKKESDLDLGAGTTFYREVRGGMKRYRVLGKGVFGGGGGGGVVHWGLGSVLGRGHVRQQMN